MCLGKHNLTHAEPSQRCFGVAGIFRHEAFDMSRGVEFDIALVRLGGDAVKSREVSYACLPGPEEVLAGGKKCYATGWGDETGAGPRVDDSCRNVSSALKALAQHQSCTRPGSLIRYIQYSISQYTTIPVLVHILYTFTAHIQHSCSTYTVDWTYTIHIASFSSGVGALWSLALCALCWLNPATTWLHSFSSLVYVNDPPSPMFKKLIMVYNSVLKQEFKHGYNYV